MAHADRPPTGRGRFASELAGVFLVLFCLYVLFVGSLGLDEALAGAVSSALASLWWNGAGRIDGKRFEGWRPALRPLLGALRGLPGATLKVAGQLTRVVLHGAPQGGVAYRHGDETAWVVSDRPAERAYGLIAASLSPDGYIVRDDEGDGGVLDHALAREGTPR